MWRPSVWYKFTETFEKPTAFGYSTQETYSLRLQYTRNLQPSATVYKKPTAFGYSIQETYSLRLQYTRDLQPSATVYKKPTAFGYSIQETTHDDLNRFLRNVAQFVTVHGVTLENTVALSNLLVIQDLSHLPIT
jgi:hypothetical protein